MATEFAQTSDHGVAETAFDAIHCKMSAVKQGYFSDDFVALVGRKPTRRIPLIHRGYYLRHVAVEAAVDLFLSQRPTPTTPVQILSLGAGLDTLFFRLQQQHVSHISMFEVDCTAITDHKIDVLTAKTSQLFGDTTNVTTSVHALMATSPTAKYVALACDLGDTAALTARLAAYGLDPSQPTLVLAECVLAYLAPTARSALLGWASALLSDALFVGYDPIGLPTAFGRQMHGYFAAKGCDLRSAKALPSVHDQASHFAAHGWRSLRLYNMNAVYRRLVDAAERQRIEALEPFDEYDDWVTCNHHYGLTLACTGVMDGGSVGAKTLGRWPRVTTHLDEAAMLDTFATGVSIRPFRPADQDAVRAIFESTLDEYDHKSVRKLVAHQLNTELADVAGSYLAPAKACFWVAERGTEFLGCVGVKPFKDDGIAELVRLRVATSARRLGVASRLVAALETFCRDVGYRAVYLETLAAMEPAKALYVRLGYAHLGSIRVGKPPLDFGLEKFQRDL
ncbi:hypothetical protein SPRG_02835 [Saprolegnia parasitica CBS 223.65]|uniref:[phosphatase 2A protein]-leucine-carboxy methyltransferase n=1 Tax=Saprolegnia parasitica (strain CBS 223.65) TaxID=695850 RepID=A0A067CPD4_SAPPC|nr:hypothetical protein SPRG_02835 [Saprolegnia parasitica CBS 223.65]KDO32358.1 hypothetical protein SPRG_02835 [Saprolegnia parasitica CBS 223.65]|eukprot:XP_012196812.1 hypothetical protein SPRG_02835 [Saprolegnia parasitica CBS 223.65]